MYKETKYNVKLTFQRLLTSDDLLNSYLIHEIVIDNFVVNEIDLEMFTTLTGENLVELGISAFGARKRLLYAINQLKAERSLLQQTFGKFSGSAAPGAERRPSAGW